MKTFFCACHLKTKINEALSITPITFAELVDKILIRKMKQRLNKLQSIKNLKGKKIIVAVSGGSDSMVLAAILKDIAGTIVIAHCNFGLRGKESNGDEKLVANWAAEHNIDCRVRHFNMPEILEEQGGNLQKVARNLRYQWFEALRLELQFDLIATAHHKQDSVETMLINFFKGTGIAGMHGILPEQGKITRPLLPFTKEELQQYALNNNIPWREDSSNKKEDYTRNAIRHQLFPVLEKLFPSVLNNLAGNTERFAEVEQLYREAVSKHTSKLMEKRQQEWYIPILKLKKLPAQKTLLWEMLQQFGFSAPQLTDIVGLLEAESGRFVASSSHRIIKSRDFLIITSLQYEESAFILIPDMEREMLFEQGTLSFSSAHLSEIGMETITKMSSNEICVEESCLHFPLILRPWKQGDYFYPLGTNAKKKKISKYLIEQKLPLHEKEKVWVLECDKKIVWVVGMRADDRFKIKNHSVKGIFISVK